MRICPCCFWPSTGREDQKHQSSKSSVSQGEERLHHCPVGPAGSVPWLSRDRGSWGWQDGQGTPGAADEHKLAGCPCSHHAQPKVTEAGAHQAPQPCWQCFLHQALAVGSGRFLFLGYIKAHTTARERGERTEGVVKEQHACE